MTVFSYDKAHKRYTWSPSVVVNTSTDATIVRLYWPLLFILCGSIIVSLSVYVFYSVAQTGIKIDITRAEREVKVLASENAELKVKLGTAISPLHLSEIAQERGLIKIQHPTYLTPHDNSLAQ